MTQHQIDNLRKAHALHRCIAATLEQASDDLQRWGDQPGASIAVAYSRGHSRRALDIGRRLKGRATEPTRPTKKGGSK